MASEIKLTTSVTWARYGAQIAATVVEVIDQSGEQAIQNVQIIGTSSEAVTLGDVTAPQYIMFKHGKAGWSTLNDAAKAASGYGTKALYDAAFVVFVSKTNPATTVAADMEVKLAPGQGVCLISSVAAWYAIAGVNPVNLIVTAIEG